MSSKGGISRSDDKGLELNLGQDNFTPIGFGQSSDTSTQYKHWNIFFKDIFRVSIEIVDRETNKVIS